MSAIVDGKAGDWFVTLTDEQYQVIREMDESFGTNTLNNNGNPFKYNNLDHCWYAKRDEILGDETVLWIEWNVISSESDLGVEFLTLSIQANVFS